MFLSKQIQALFNTEYHLNDITESLEHLNFKSSDISKGQKRTFSSVKLPLE